MVAGAEGRGLRLFGGGDLRERRAEMRAAAVVVRKEAREGEAGGPAAELGGVGREVCFVGAIPVASGGAIGVCGRDCSSARSLASSSS